MNQQLVVPQGFMLDEFERDLIFTDEAMASVWKKLQLRETFTKGQLFPYRVEFAASSQERVLYWGT